MSERVLLHSGSEKDGKYLLEIIENGNKIDKEEWNTNYLIKGNLEFVFSFLPTIEEYLSLENKISLLIGKIEEMKNFDKEEIEETEKPKEQFVNLKPSFLCSQCKQVMKEAFNCLNCERSLCKKCLVNNEKCPNSECNGEKVYLNESKSKLIQNLQVKCSFCNENVSYFAFEKHYSEHKYACKYSEFGCEVSDTKIFIKLHQFECPKRILYEHKQMKQMIYEMVELGEKIKQDK